VIAVWGIAVKTLIADRGKLLTAVVGVVFSVVLVNVQGGLFVGLIRKASLLVDQGDADIWVGHKEMKNVDFPHDIPRAWGQRIRALDGVKRAEPYLVGHNVMTLPSGGFEQVLVVGCDPATLLGNASRAASDDVERVREADGILVDRCDANKIGNPRVGDIREIGQRRARVVGFTDGVLGFLVTPYVFTTRGRAAAYLHKPPRYVSYFLVQVADGADPREVCQRIRERLPDAEAYTRDRYAFESIGYWLKRTGLGISFGASTILGLIVGLAIVAQTLYASVLDRISEFGSMKAMGARERQICGIILRQAVALAAVGSAVGLVVVLAVQSSFSTPRAPIAVPWPMAVGSLALVTMICLASSLAPYLRIRSIDPAMVLQG
jgi:putative ABC transport system permease protein